MQCKYGLSVLLLVSFLVFQVTPNLPLDQVYAKDSSEITVLYLYFNHYTNYGDNFDLIFDASGIDIVPMNLSDFINDPSLGDNFDVFIVGHSAFGWWNEAEPTKSLTIVSSGKPVLAMGYGGGTFFEGLGYGYGGGSATGSATNLVVEGDSILHPVYSQTYAFPLPGSIVISKSGNSLYLPNTHANTTYLGYNSNNNNYGMFLENNGFEQRMLHLSIYGAPTSATTDYFKLIHNSIVWLHSTENQASVLYLYSNLYVNQVTDYQTIFSASPFISIEGMNLSRFIAQPELAQRFDLIIVGHSAFGWWNQLEATRSAAIVATGLPILALGYGGGTFFEGLGYGYGGGAAGGTATNLVVDGGTELHPVFSQLYNFTLPGSIAIGKSGNVMYLLNTHADTTYLGYNSDNSNYGMFAENTGFTQRMLHMSINGAPTVVENDYYKLIHNSVEYLSGTEFVAVVTDTVTETQTATETFIQTDTNGISTTTVTQTVTGTNKVTHDNTVIHEVTTTVTETISETTNVTQTINTDSANGPTVPIQSEVIFLSLLFLGLISSRRARRQ